MPRFESGNYYREGNFIIGTDSTGEIRLGSAIKTEGWGPNGWRLFVKINDVWVEDTKEITLKECVCINDMFTLKEERAIYQVPTFEPIFCTHQTLPAGTYPAKKVSMEFVELEKPDGSTAWVSSQYIGDGETFLSTNYGYFHETLPILSVTSINEIPIKQKIMPIREDKRTGLPMKPQYVTIHNTSNVGKGANALAHANLQLNDSRKWTSWHFSVDNNEIYQSIPMNEIGYHCGDGVFIGNATTIGIEICENEDGNYSQAEKNAAYLTAQILYENKLPSDCVRMHNNWSGKNCPHNIIEGTKGSMGWDSFKKCVAEYYNHLASANISSN